LDRWCIFTAQLFGFLAQQTIELFLYMQQRKNTTILIIIAINVQSKNNPIIIAMIKGKSSMSHLFVTVADMKQKIHEAHIGKHSRYSDNIAETGE